MTAVRWVRAGALAAAAAVLLLGVVTGVATARADAPVRPDRDQAREWALRELLGREYQQHRPGLVEQAWDWLREQWAKLELPQGVPGQLGAVIVLVLLAAGLSFVLWQTGGLGRRRALADSEGVFTDPGTTAAGHRAAADAAEAAGDHRTAVIERFRGLVRGLQERALLEPQPGQTADEAAQAAAGWLPPLADELAAAARVFDDVRYGELPATAAAVATLRELDERVQRTRPAATTAAVSGPEVPR